MPTALGLKPFDAQSRIVGNHPDFDGVVEQVAQHLSQIVRRVRRRRLCGDEGGDVLVLKMRDALVTVLVAEIFEDAATHDEGRSR
jgi:hypothetical protein